MLTGASYAGAEVSSKDFKRSLEHSKLSFSDQFTGFFMR